MTEKWIYGDVWYGEWLKKKLTSWTREKIVEAILDDYAHACMLSREDAIVDMHACANLPQSTDITKLVDILDSEALIDLYVSLVEGMYLCSSENAADHAFARFELDLVHDGFVDFMRTE